MANKKVSNKLKKQQIDIASEIFDVLFRHSENINSENCSELIDDTCKLNMPKGDLMKFISLLLFNKISEVNYTRILNSTLKKTISTLIDENHNAGYMHMDLVFVPSICLQKNELNYNSNYKLLNNVLNPILTNQHASKNKFSRQTLKRSGTFQYKTRSEYKSISVNHINTTRTIYSPNDSDTRVFGYFSVSKKGNKLNYCSIGNYHSESMLNKFLKEEFDISLSLFVKCYPDLFN